MIEALESRGYERLDNHWFGKIIKKINDYVDKNGNYRFTTTFLVGMYICLDSSETMVVDSYLAPLEPFKIRTRNDAISFNKLLNELQEDLDYLEIEDDVAIQA